MSLNPDIVAVIKEYKPQVLVLEREKIVEKQSKVKLAAAFVLGGVAVAGGIEIYNRYNRPLPLPPPTWFDTGYEWAYNKGSKLASDYAYQLSMIVAGFVGTKIWQYTPNNIRLRLTNIQNAVRNLGA